MAIIAKRPNCDAYDIQLEILKVFFKSRISQWANFGCSFSCDLKLMKVTSKNEQADFFINEIYRLEIFT